MDEKGGGSANVTNMLVHRIQNGNGLTLRYLLSEHTSLTVSKHFLGASTVPMAGLDARNIAAAMDTQPDALSPSRAGGGGGDEEVRKGDSLAG